MKFAGYFSGQSPISPSRILKIFLTAALTLFPIVRIFHILLSYGANNLSVDDAVIVPLVTKILGGNYQWKNFFHDTFINGHSQVFPVLGHVFFARFFSWNVFPILYFGVFLTSIQLLLTFDIFCRFSKNQYRWILFPTLSFLFFATSRLTVFEFEFPSLQVGLCYLGVLLGLWGLVRFRGRWLGIGWMLVGGFLASWSWASGALVWPIYFLSLLLLGERKPAFFAIWLLAGIVATSPYFYFLFLHPVSDLYSIVEVRSRSGSLTFVSWFNVEFLIKALGWPFSQGFSLQEAFRKGCIGVVFLLSGLAILWSRRNTKNFDRYVPSILVLAFGLLNIWEISLFRWYLAQWYAAPFLFFWIGLAGMAYAFSADRARFYANRGVGQDLRQGISIIWSELLLVALVFLYLSSNLTFGDKSFYLQTRSPVSASCLRHYRTAPTYCESSLFLWPPGQYWLLSALGKPLEENQLSVFGPRQKWTLQGDFFSGNVNIHEDPGVPETYWSPDLTSASAPAWDYRHLNLFLHSPNYVDWRITLPLNVKRAEFHSAMAISRSAPLEPISDGVDFEVSIQPSDKEMKPYFSRHVDPDQREWEPFSIDLSPFAGQTITLRLTTRMGKNYIHDWAMFRYPFIDIETTLGGGAENWDNDVAPSNVLSSEPDPKGDRDFIMDLKDPALWEPNRVEISLNQMPWLRRLLGPVPPQFEYKKKLNLCLEDYSRVEMVMTAAPEIYPRAAQILMKWNGSSFFQKDIRIPLLPDGQSHRYSYDIRLLKPLRGVRLTGIRLNPILSQGKPIMGSIQVEDFRLVHRPEANYCTKSEDE
ncbi:MAG: hypothetical protein U1F66_05250 [bacterium]